MLKNENDAVGMKVKTTRRPDPVDGLLEWTYPLRERSRECWATDPERSDFTDFIHVSIAVPLHDVPNEVSRMNFLDQCLMLLGCLESGEKNRRGVKSGFTR